MSVGSLTECAATVFGLTDNSQIPHLEKCLAKSSVQGIEILAEQPSHAAS
jgi:hypothetical protein